MQKIAVTPIFTGVTAILLSSNCQRRDFMLSEMCCQIILCIAQNELKFVFTKKATLDVARFICAEQSDKRTRTVYHNSTTVLVLR